MHIQNQNQNQNIVIKFQNKYGMTSKKFYFDLSSCLNSSNKEKDDIRKEKIPQYFVPFKSYIVSIQHEQQWSFWKGRSGTDDCE